MRKNFGGYLATTALALSLATLAPLGDSVAASDTSKWDAFLDVGGTVGEREKGEVNAFVPILQDRASMLFLDLRGKLFSEGVTEGNAGVGYRRLVRPGAIAGVYGFFDIRHTEANNTFRQVSLGAEYLEEGWETRVNVYVPLNDSERVTSVFGVGGTTTLDTSGGNLVLLRDGATRIDELALWGFDVEAGMRLPAFTDDPDQEIRVFGGAFYFDHQDLDSNQRLIGPMARIEYRIHDVLGLGPQSRFTIAAEGRWDDEREGAGFVSATLRIPLQSFTGRGMGGDLTGIERRMVDPIRRDVDIVTVDHGTKVNTRENVRNAATGRVIQGLETVSNPTDVSAAVAAAGEDHVIVLDGDLGTFNDGSTIVLSDGQVLIGGGSSLAVRGVTTGTSATFTAGGSRATVGGGGATQDLVQMGNDTMLVGLDLRDGDNAIIASNTSGAKIYDVEVFDPASAGISAFDTVNLMIRDSLVSGAGTSGIRHEDSVGTMILNSTISNSTDFGILGARGADMLVSGLTVTQSGLSGIGLFSMTDLTLTNVVVDTAGQHAINVSSNGLVIDGLDLSNATLDGLRVSSTANADIRNVMVSNVGATGVALGGGATGIADAVVSNFSVDGAREGVTIFGGTGAQNVTVQNFAIANSTLNGVRLEDGGVDTTIRNGTVDMSGQDGLLFNRATGTLIDSVLVTDSGRDGIGVFGATDTTITNVQIDTTGGQGMNIASQGLTINGATVLNTGVDGLRLSNSANVDVNNLNLTNIGATGVALGGGANGVTDASFNNVSVDGATTGISMFAANGLEGIVFTNANLTGIANTGVLINGNNHVGPNTINLTGLNIVGAGSATNAVNILNLGANADVSIDGLTTSGTFTAAPGRFLRVHASTAGATFSLDNSTLDGVAITGFQFDGPLAIGGANNALNTNGIVGTACASGASVTGSVQYVDSSGTAQTCP